MTAIGDKIAAGREGRRTFYGWAVLSVDSAERMGRTVRVTPLADNPYHADMTCTFPKGRNNGTTVSSTSRISLTGLNGKNGSRGSD